MPTNLPGGRIVSGYGGYLNVFSALAPTWTRLDVARWESDREIRIFKKGHSGTYGVPAVRKTGEHETINLRVWWALDNPPEELLRTTIGGLGMEWGCGLQLGIGSAAVQAALGVTPQRFLLLPSCMMTRFKVLDSSECENDDIVIADAQVQANASPVFLMPTDSAAYTTWANTFGARGEFSSYGALNTMQ